MCACFLVRVKARGSLTESEGAQTHLFLLIINVTHFTASLHSAVFFVRRHMRQDFLSVCIPATTELKVIKWGILLDSPLLMFYKRISLIRAESIADLASGPGSLQPSPLLHFLGLLSVYSCLLL